MGNKVNRIFGAMFLVLIQYLKHSLVRSRLSGITPSSSWMLSIGVVTNVLAIILRLDSIQAGQYFWTSTPEGWGSILYNRYHIDVVDSQKHFPIRPPVRATKHPKEVEVCLASV